MRLTALTPSFVRQPLPAEAMPAVNAMATSEQAPAPRAMEQREPRRTPLSIEEFVRFARNAGAL